MWSSSARSLLATTFFSSTVVNHVLAKLFVSCESVVETHVVLFFALLLERIGDVVLSVTWISSNGAHGVALSLCCS